MQAPSEPGTRPWYTTPWTAYIAPLAAFLLLQALTDLLRVNEPGAPWWRTHPEHWVYPLQTLTGLAMLACWWRHYEFGRLRPKLIIFSSLLGLIGIGCWIAPVAFGWAERTNGFDPSALTQDPRLVTAIVAVRLIRLVVVASFVEEIFWRGFLQRFLVDTQADFWKIPLGTFTWASAIWTTLAVVLIHGLADWPAAAVWGVLVAFLYVRARSLSACILMHAIANLLLGIYVLTTRNWGLW